MQITRLFLVSVFLAPLAAGALPLTDPHGQYPLETQVSFSEDKTTHLSVYDIAALPEDKWAPNTRRSLNFGFTASAWWFRFKLKDETKGGPQWLLKVAYPHLDRIEVHLRDKKTGKFETKTSGDFYPFSSRYIKYRHFLFPLVVEKTESEYVYVRVQSESAFNVPLSVVSETEQTQQTIDEQFVFGIYYGILLVMILYNLFLYLSARDLGYLLYVAFLLAVGFMNLSLNGFLPQYFTGDMVWLTNSAPPFFTELSIATGIVFSYFFLRIHEAHRVFRYAFASVFIMAVLAALGHPFIKYKFAIIASNIMALIGLPLMIASGVYSLLRGYHPARYYLLSWTLLIIGGALFSLRNFGIIPDGSLARYSLQIGSAAEMILLSLALGDRLRQLKEEREQALTGLVDEQKRALEKERSMADSFSRFVPKQFLTHLGKEHIEEVALGDAVERKMAVLFSDIRSFTALSETMSPRENFAFLNSYLKRVGPIVRKHSGFIDKYIGDAVMALFPGAQGGADSAAGRMPPGWQSGGAEDALRAAIDMQAELREFNHHRLKKNYDPVKIGVGLHSGTLYLGTIGEAERMDSTVISDTVNVASRIEHLTKKLGAAVLMSGEFFAKIPDTTGLNTRFLGKLPIRGKSERIDIHEILDGQSEYLVSLHKETLADFSHGILTFHAKRYAEAAAAFAVVLERNPADRVAQLYAEQCRLQLARS